VTWPLVQVDAFTAEPFAGNLSETAFLRPAGEAGRWRLRWFTPTVEVELCGHATLASAHVLWTEGRVGAGEPIRFDTASGPLAARPGPGGAIWLDFPATPAAPVEPPDGPLDALGGGAARFVGRGRFDYLVELADEAAVRGRLAA
jgi:predicted PhzF superfamily epimerase YddE/YHI9